MLYEICEMNYIIHALGTRNKKPIKQFGKRMLMGFLFSSDGYFILTIYRLPKSVTTIQIHGIDIVVSQNSLCQIAS